MVKDLDESIAAQQDVKKKRKLEYDRKTINVNLLGNLSTQKRKKLTNTIRNYEESLAEAKRNAANPRSEKDRLHWEARAKRVERRLKELREILRKG
jgi:ppGpp synthetase/RelA/SpoT-type nucleotidyltranferase